MCRKIGGLDEPVFVDVSPRADSGGDDCFMCVRRHVDEHGGSIQHGWTIWEWPGISAEGEFHAVWRKPDGQLLDVTQKKDRESRIVFAPDPKRVFENRRVASIRMAIGRNPRILRWIELNERYDKLVSRAFQNVSFGTKVVIKGEVVDLRHQLGLLSIELEESRESRRADSASFPML
jgi:hypothetical protein